MAIGSVGQSVGGALVAMATTFGLGAESSRLPACQSNSKLLSNNRT